MCLILFTYDDEISVWRCSDRKQKRGRKRKAVRSVLNVSVCECVLCHVHLQMPHPFEFTTDLRARRMRAGNKRATEKIAKHETVTIVMVCNGLMTSSKDLQQLSCYSNCCWRRSRAHRAHIYKSQRIHFGQIIFKPCSFSFASLI